jgi:hypothetical protein
VGILTGGWFDPNPDRGDDDLTPRERKALFDENDKTGTGKGVKAAIEERCLEAWWKL